MPTSVDINLFTPSDIEMNLMTDVMGATQRTLPYAREVEPIDESDFKDDIVMRDETEGDVRIVGEGIVEAEIDINVPYAQRRNFENNLNPDKTGYIEKIEDELLRNLMEVDYAEIIEH